MSEKVMLTAVQAEAIEEGLKFRKGNKDVFVKEHIDVCWDEEGAWMHEFKSLNDLDIGTFAKALYIGYEIEKPKFQPGDKVVLIKRPHKILVIKSIDSLMSDSEEGRAWIYTDGEWDYESGIRHATPEEIYWLETLGREKVGDFKTGDIFVEKDGDVSIIGSGQGFSVPLDEAKSLYQSNAFFGLYPAESFKSFPEEDAE